LKKAMQAAEKKVEASPQRLARLDRLLTDPQLYARDPAAAKSAGIARGQFAKQLAEAEEAWLAASEAYEGACAEVPDAAQA
jgi:ATP-binding cassette subfamily F protein 3